MRQPTEERRRQIADAALEIIAAQGLRRFTTAAIAAEVGISDGTIFRHFESKAEIVGAAIDRAEARLFADFPPTDEDPLTRLGAFFRQRAELVVRRPAIVRLALSDQLAQAAGPEGAARVEGWKTRTLGFIRECLAEAGDAGLLRADDLPSLVLLVQGGLAALLLSADRAGGAEHISARAGALWETLERLIRA